MSKMAINPWFWPFLALLAILGFKCKGKRGLKGSILDLPENQKGPKTTIFWVQKGSKIKVSFKTAFKTIFDMISMSRIKVLSSEKISI